MDFGICEYHEDERSLCDGIFLDDDRRFSIKLDENFEVDTVSVGERSNFKKIPTHTQDHGDA